MFTKFSTNKIKIFIFRFQTIDIFYRTMFNKLSDSDIYWYLFKEMKIFALIKKQEYFEN